MHAATGFKSTQDAMNAIANTYNTLLQAPNIFDKNISFKELVELGDKLNAHIMGKQGILLGSKSNLKSMFRKSSMGEPEKNIFDLWNVMAFDLFTKIVNALKIVKGTQSADNKAGNLLKIWQTNGVLETVVTHARNIFNDAQLEGKKKLADIIIFFMEHNKELINKAVKDFEYLKGLPSNE
jgi:hypothetical protein